MLVTRHRDQNQFSRYFYPWSVVGWIRLAEEDEREQEPRGFRPLWLCAARAQKRSAASEPLWGGAQPTLLDHLTILCVDEAQVGVLVAHVQSGCHLWFVPAIIHCGPILLPFGRFRARRTFADPLVGYCVSGGSAFSSHLR